LIVNHISPFSFSVRPVNILCDSEHQRLRLTNFGNAVDLDPPRVGLDNDRLVVDTPVSIANTLAADVFSVALIVCQLLFDVPEKALNRQLKGVGYDLDLWLQQAFVVGSNSTAFVDALDYLRDRRGIWGFLKGAIRPNPLRKVCRVLYFWLIMTLVFFLKWSISHVHSYKNTSSHL
jgi:hypothetical protein